VVNERISKKIQINSGNMGKRIFKTGVLIGAITAAGGIANAKSAAIGYLAKVGPVPLRFLPRITKIGVLPPLPDGSSTPASNPQIPNPPPQSDSATAPQSATPPAQIPADPASPLSDAPADQSPDSLLPVIENPAPDPASTPHSANDLLVVTPQMLIEYFKPVGSSTNNAGVSVLGPVNFTPPTPAVAPSSRAVYKTD